MIRCNTSISLTTVTVDGWPVDTTGEAVATHGGRTAGSDADRTTTDLAGPIEFGISAPMPRSSRPETRNVEPSYPAWLAAAAKDLQRDHGAMTAIRERVWTQFYIRRLGPKEAAERAATEYNNSRRPKWVKARR
jgi:hypothetical protein